MGRDLKVYLSFIKLEHFPKIDEFEDFIFPEYSRNTYLPFYGCLTIDDLNNLLLEIQRDCDLESDEHATDSIYAIQCIIKIMNEYEYEYCYTLNG